MKELHLTIPGIKKKADFPPNDLQQLSLLFLHEAYTDQVHVYADGSVTTFISAGAVTIPQRSIDIHFKLPNSTTSTGSVLIVIREALLFIQRESQEKWALLCYPRPALQCTQSALRRGPY